MHELAGGDVCAGLRADVGATIRVNPLQRLARVVTFVLIALIAWLSCLPASAEVAVPPLQRRVTDLTGALTANDVTALEQKLRAIEQKKGAQLAILIVPTTQPESVEQYAIRVVDQWKLGRSEVQGKRVDDGVLILVARNDRKLRIEVGYGLEGAIPDALAKRIIAESISPKFKQGQFAEGLSAGVDELAKLIEGEALPPAWEHGHAPASVEDPFEAMLFSGIAFLLAAFVGSLVVRSIFGRVLGSLGAGGLTGFLAQSAFGMMPVSLFAGMVAFVMTAASSSSGVRRTGRHTYTGGPWVGIPSGGWGGSGSSGGSWGSSGGSDSSWGGGGGSFGGGGASGDW